MNLLAKHRHDYKTLKKTELWKIIEEQIVIQRRKLDKHIYNPLLIDRNNNRRALRKYWNKRHTSGVAVAKVKEKVVKLREIKIKLEKGL